MRTFLLVAATLLAAAFTPAEAAPRWSIVVHGGAGVIERKDLTPEQDTAYRAAMARATETGARRTQGGRLRARCRAKPASS